MHAVRRWLVRIVAWRNGMLGLCFGDDVSGRSQRLLCTVCPRQLQYHRPGLPRRRCVQALRRWHLHVVLWREVVHAVRHWHLLVDFWRDVLLTLPFGYIIPIRQHICHRLYPAGIRR